MFYFKNSIVLIIIILVIIGIISVFFVINLDRNQIEETIIEEDVVAIVNGEKILLSDIKTVYLKYNQDMNNYKSYITPKSILENSINEILILQEAKSKGIKVSSEEVDKRIHELNEHFPMLYKKITKEEGLEKYKIMLKDRMLYQKMHDKIIEESNEELSITDEEAYTWYKTKSNEATKEKFQKIKVDIHNKIKIQKEQEIFNRWISKKRDNAKIIVYNDKIKELITDLMDKEEIMDILEIEDNSAEQSCAEPPWIVGSLEEAEKLLGEKILFPQYIPSGFKCTTINVPRDNSLKKYGVTLEYTNDTQYFTIGLKKEHRSYSEEYKVIDINGNTGYINYDKSEPSDKIIDGTVNLGWTLNGVVYHIRAVNMSEFEVVKIARSIK